MICSAPDAYNLLKEGKLDGVCMPWEGVYSFNMMDFCKYHTEISMYTMPFFVVMNKDRYESFPSYIRKIIDENSGEEMAALAGRVMDEVDITGKKFAQKNDHFIYTMPESELQRWKELTMPVGDEWVKEMQAKDLPGQEVLSFVVDLFLQLQK